MSATKGHAFELIPLTIEAKGEVIASNVDEFRELVREALGTINREPETDEEFGQAEVDVKALKGAEDSVKAAKEKALTDAEQLHALFTALDDTSEEIRQARLELERQIKVKKTEVRDKMISDALEQIDSPIATKVFAFDAEQALKGKKALASMKKALSVTVATINGMIEKSRKVLDQFEGEHGKEMILDRQDLEVKRPDQVEAELRRRLDLKKADDEKKAAQEEAIKAKEEAAKAAAELAASKKPADPLPAAPKIGSIPVGPSAENQDATKKEWEEFKQASLEAFSRFRAARLKLKHEANIKRAQAFADTLGTAWKEVAK